MARHVAIAEVSVFQGVKVTVAKNNTAVPTAKRRAPIVSGRPGVLRVYATPDKEWKAHELTAELRIRSDASTVTQVMRVHRLIEQPSTEGTKESSGAFDFELPASAFAADTSFQIALTDDSADPVTSQPDSAARYPKDGTFAELLAESSGKLRVVVVPLQYEADGSHRLPDMSQASLESYRRTLLRMYPTHDVELRVHKPLVWNSTISSNGNGFPTVLRAITQLREEDNADDDEYYYGIFAPKATMQAYCQGGCVTGLSAIVDDAASASMRASIGIGFAEKESIDTMAHELGHAHGREHAPCGGPQGVDPRYPYPGGGIGVWGYDIVDHTFIPPTQGKDVMGYCKNKWVSDYTYVALFERLSKVGPASVPENQLSRIPGPPANYRVAVVGHQSSLEWNGELRLRRELVGGEPKEVVFASQSGSPVLSRTARFFRFDHLPGGFLLVPNDEEVQANAWSSVHVNTISTTLSR